MSLVGIGYIRHETNLRKKSLKKIQRMKRITKNVGLLTEKWTKLNCI